MGNAMTHTELAEAFDHASVLEHARINLLLFACITTDIRAENEVFRDNKRHQKLH